MPPRVSVAVVDGLKPFEIVAVVVFAAISTLDVVAAGVVLIVRPAEVLAVASVGQGTAPP